MELRNKRHAEVWPIFLAAGVVALVLLLMAYIVEQQSIEKQRLIAQNQVRESLKIIQARLENELSGNVQLARGLVAVIAANPRLSRGEFEKVAKPLFEGRSLLRNIGLAPDMVMRYVYPMQGNEKAIGLNFRTDPKQKDSAIRARDTGNLVLAGPLTLVQGGQGLVARFPVFIDDQEGERYFWGLISVVLDVNRLYKEAGLSGDTLPIELAIRGKDGKGALGELFYGQPDLFGDDSVRMTVTLPVGAWEMAARPRHGWDMQHNGVLPIRYGFGLALLVSLSALFFLGLSIYRRNQTEGALLQTSAQLSQAQRIAKIGSWALDLESKELRWSLEIFRILEIDSSTSNASYEIFLNAVHPDDRDTVRLAYVRSLDTQEPYDIVHRLRMADGRIKHVHGRCESEFDAHGRALRSIGTVQDITEQMAAEDRVRLYGKLFEHTGEAIMITDRENQIVEVNAAFSTLTGYSTDEIRGQNPRVLAAGSTPRETYQSMWKSLNDVGYWQGELWDRRKDGSIYPKWVSISAIRDEGGMASHYVASFSDISERKAAEERMERLARYDALTGLFNRFSLHERLEQALALAHRDQRHLALMFIDMDRFKIINDTLGHQVGDDLLVQVAQRLQACVRESDIVARLGGDEFVVVLTDNNSAINAAATVAQKILEQLGKPYVIHEQELHSTPSIGVSLYPNDGVDVSALMKAADTAMYHAKEKGRNNAQFFTVDMNKAASERLYLERELRLAVERQQFELHYQPQILSQGGICGVEALIRWRHPDKGLISPIKFIPLAEEIGLIEVIGTWVIAEACRQLAAWKKARLHPGRIAVNLSARQLHSATLVNQVQASMQQYDIQTGELELEITESVAMADPERAIGQLLALQQLGVELAIDDFGTGYSSLAYLKLLPIQTLKLDRSFVKDLESNQDDAAICSATVVLAHSLGLKVVAEGVETDAQRTFLTTLQCEVLQGYLFSKPLPAQDLAEYIKNYV